MHINESNEFTIQRIMKREALDYDEAKEFLRELIEDEEMGIDLDDYEEDDRCGLGDCYGDAQ
ncbi:MAG: hypothetical protein LW696_07750 [Alphaproteobacteria bacterium]|jgi:predicted transcriptional regulator|nr:hypothetical protein [Alphaproteobacteria bacterium]